MDRDRDRASPSSLPTDGNGSGASRLRRFRQSAGRTRTRTQTQTRTRTRTQVNHVPNSTLGPRYTSSSSPDRVPSELSIVLRLLSLSACPCSLGPKVPKCTHQASTKFGAERPKRKYTHEKKKTRRPCSLGTKAPKCTHASPPQAPTRNMGTLHFGAEGPITTEMFIILHLKPPLICT